MQTPQWIQNFTWDRQKTVYTVVGGILLLLVGSLFFRGDDEQQAEQLPPAPAAPVQAVPTLTEDLEAVAQYFPHLRVNESSVPYTVPVDVEAVGTETKSDLEEGVTKVMKTKGVELKELVIESFTILVHEEGDRFSGFLVRFKALNADGDVPLHKEVWLKDEWKADASAEFARKLRESVESNPLFTLRSGDGEESHNVRLRIEVPLERDVQPDN